MLWLILFCLFSPLVKSFTSKIFKTNRFPGYVLISNALFWKKLVLSFFFPVGFSVLEKIFPSPTAVVKWKFSHCQHWAVLNNSNFFWNQWLFTWGKVHILGLFIYMLFIWCPCLYWNDAFSIVYLQYNVLI